MKKCLFFILLACIQTLTAQAQIAQVEPQVMFYSNGYFANIPVSRIDSIVYSDTDYDMSVGEPSYTVDESGNIHLRANVDACFSIKQLKAAIVDGAKSREEIIADYAMGKISGMVNITNKADLVTDEASHKILVVGFDEEGKMRGYDITDSLSFYYSVVHKMRSALTDVWSMSSHCFFGYPANMIIRDMMTGDYYHYGQTDYSHFISWQRNQYMGDAFLKTQFTWNFYDGIIRQLNQYITWMNRRSKKTTIDEQLLAEMYVRRAAYYLDAARLYEFLGNGVTSPVNQDGNNVLGLTVPIIDGAEPNDTVQAKRATRSEMAAYIMAELNKAQNQIAQSSDNSVIPTLAVVYGLKARLALWNEDYTNAAEYARLAIQYASVQPITKDRALSVTEGYNMADEFMWCAQQTEEDDCVSSEIINWISWVSNQTTFGYTGPTTGLYTIIDKSLYERISDSDWRKLQWVAPYGSALYGQSTIPYVSDFSLGNYLPEYASVKFRPGNGGTEDYNVGAVTAIPLMRVEEMYYIQAEALARGGNETAARQVLANIMMTRDPNYSCSMSGDDLIDEIIFQKRIELWGEGQSYFDIKRLNLSVTRGYTGTNCQDAQSRLNTSGRPAWMNFVIVKSATRFNPSLEGWNNPDPSDLYSPWTE